jgi:hypothetical protein
MDNFIIKYVNINVPIKYFDDGTYEIVIDDAEYQYDDKKDIQINNLDIEKNLNQKIIKDKHNFSLKHKKIKHNKSKKIKTFLKN